MTVKQAAYEVMKAAYLKASANDTLPAKARQIMYKARGAIQERTGKQLDDKYFTQTLLPDFMAENPELTAGWKVVFDARGHLIEPHTGRSLPLGTIEVRDISAASATRVGRNPAASMPGIGTSGPSGRYGAVLFCEKEGFNELFEAVRLAERYDLAIMSTKGVSVTAARHLVDEICARYQIPLFVLHDFDKSGRRQREALQSGRVQAIGPAGQQHPVAGLDPRRQGVSEPAQQQVTGINGHPLAGIGDRHLVEPVEQQERRARLEVREKERAGQAVRRRAIDPSSERPFQVATLPAALAAAARHFRPELAERQRAAAAGRAMPPAAAPRTLPAPELRGSVRSRRCSATPPIGRRWTCRLRPGPGREAIPR